MKARNQSSSPVSSTMMCCPVSGKAIAKLISVGEFFGCEDNDADPQYSQKEYEQWSAKIEEFKKWVDEESPIA